MDFFFHRHTCLHLSRFFSVSSENIYPINYIVLVTVCLSLVSNGILFLLQNTLSTNVTVVSDQGWASFFHRHTCHAFFATLSASVTIVSVKEWVIFFELLQRWTKFSYITSCAQNAKAEEGTCYSLSHCYAMTKMQPSGNLLSFYAVSTSEMPHLHP